MQCRCCGFVDFVGLIPGICEVDAVGLKVSWETAVVACPIVVPEMLVLLSAGFLDPHTSVV